MKNILAPSLLSANFSNLKQDIDAVTKAGATYLHLDVMDGAFVPSISFGIPVIKSIRKDSNLVFDVHLMIENPDRYLQDFKDAGADIICVHEETTKHLDRTLTKIREIGAKAAVAINPATPICNIKHVLSLCDMVLLMSVNPGFGGQKYIGYVTDKIRDLTSLRSELGLDFDIEVDGGINIDNVRDVINAGANVIVAGSAVFLGDPEKNAEDFMKLINE